MSRTLLGTAAVAAVAFVGLSIGLRAQAPGTTAAVGDEALPLGTPLDRQVPTTHLKDAAGGGASLQALRGKWIVLVPTMTLCHEVCPITTGALLKLRSRLRAGGLARRVAIVAVSVDPWRDTPQRMRAYRRLTGARLRLWTGSVRRLRRFWAFFGVSFHRVPPGRPAGRDWLTGRPERFDVEHSDGLFLLDPSGRERVAIAGMPGVGGRLRGRLHALLDSRGRANLADPTVPWTPGGVAADLAQLMGVRTPPPGASSPGATQRRLAGSPQPLVALHRQAGMLLSGDEGLGRRIAALRGFPIVLNAWASWCPPCREELPLFAAAAMSFGRRVAFLGADLEDDAGAAKQLLAEVGPAYPSYPATMPEASEISPVEGTPYTVFIGPDGQVRGRHIGAYSSQAALDTDIRAYVR
jgi:cytochrome c biogenesis protein CcmG, thiol:disulfide interchange protein DsbE